MIKKGITFIISIFLFSCVSVTERQQQLVSKYLADNSGIDQRVRSAIKTGKVISGMNPEQVYLASGEKAREFKTHSIWVVREDGSLTLPPTAIRAGTPTALLFKYRTQFDTKTDEPFIVYMSGDKKVLKVERGTSNIK